MTQRRELALAQLNLSLLADVPPVELPQDRELELSTALANLLLSAAGSDIRVESKEAAYGESETDA